MARRKSTKTEIMDYPYTPERQLEVKSGWCMTSHHDSCRHEFNHGKCGCDCHKAII